MVSCGKICFNCSVQRAVWMGGRESPPPLSPPPGRSEFTQLLTITLIIKFRVKSFGHPRLKPPCGKNWSETTKYLERLSFLYSSFSIFFFQLSLLLLSTSLLMMFLLQLLLFLFLIFVNVLSVVVLWLAWLPFHFCLSCCCCCRPCCLGCSCCCCLCSCYCWRPIGWWLACLPFLFCVTSCCWCPCCGRPFCFWLFFFCKCWGWRPAVCILAVAGVPLLAEHVLLSDYHYRTLP